MSDTVGDGDGEPDRGVYDRSTDANPDIGTWTACELCQSDALCVENHGFLACRDCHRELLPRDALF